MNSDFFSQPLQCSFSSLPFRSSPVTNLANQPALTSHDFLYQSSSGSSVPALLCVLSHLNNKILTARGALHVLCGCLSHLTTPPPPPPLLAFSALSNVSKVTKMFSESRLLGAKRGQAHFLSHPSLSILLFHDTKWSVNETQKSCQGKKNSALKTKETKKTRHRFL